MTEPKKFYKPLKDLTPEEKENLSDVDKEFLNTVSQIEAVYDKLDEEERQEFHRKTLELSGHMTDEELEFLKSSAAELTESVCSYQKSIELIEQKLMDLSKNMSDVEVNILKESLENFKGTVSAVLQFQNAIREQVDALGGKEEKGKVSDVK